MSATIAARAHSGSTLSAPARRRAPQRRNMPWLARVARLIGRKPGRALLMLIFTGVAMTILLNALLFQTARHPAPMASAPAPSQTPPVVERRAETPAAAPALPVATPASAPVPPSRPSDLSQAARETHNRPPAAISNVARTVAVPATAPSAPARAVAAPRDPIGDMINGGDFRPPAEIRGGSRAASVRRSAEN